MDDKSHFHMGGTKDKEEPVLLEIKANRGWNDDAVFICINAELILWCQN